MSALQVNDEVMDINAIAFKEDPFRVVSVGDGVAILSRYNGMDKNAHLIEYLRKTGRTFKHKGWWIFRKWVPV